MQVARHQGDGFASADQQRLAALQVAEDLSRQADRGESHRHRVLADGGVGPYGLGRAEGGLEQPPEQRADAASLARDGVGRLHLSKDLRLAQHQRIEPGGDTHHMTHGLVVDVHVGAGLELVEAEAVIVGQPGQHGIGFDLILLQVQFTAIAGRENRRLTRWRDATQLAQGLDHLIRREGYALADVHRSGLVIDTKREESHAEPLIGKRSAQFSYFV